MEFAPDEIGDLLQRRREAILPKFLNGNYSLCILSFIYIERKIFKYEKSKLGRKFVLNSSLKFN